MIFHTHKKYFMYLCNTKVNMGGSGAHRHYKKIFNSD
jgi:hypothetical protein